MVGIRAVKKTANRGTAMSDKWLVRFWTLGTLHTAHGDRDAMKALYSVLEVGYACQKAQLVHGMEIVMAFDRTQH